MKVLMVMNGPRDDEERIVHARRLPALLRALRARGVDVHVALLGDAAGLGGDLVEAGGDVHVIDTRLPPAASSLTAMPKTVRRLRALIRSVTPDVVDGDEPMPAIAAALASMRRRRPVVMYHRHHYTGRRRLRAASFLAAHLADTTVVSTEILRQRARQDDRRAADRIVVAPSGTPDLRHVAPAEVAQARCRLEIPPDAVVVGVVSRLRREKGIDVLLAAMDRLPRSGMHVVIVGSGPEESRLRSAASGVATPVHMVGYQRDVALWLALSDVVSIPSRHESFGRTTVEAMAAGCAIVASRVGGLEEAIEDGVTGLLVRPEDPEDLAQALGRLATDPIARRAMGRAARRRYEERYTIDDMASSWAAAWKSAPRDPWLPAVRARPC